MFWRIVTFWVGALDWTRIRVSFIELLASGKATPCLGLPYPDSYRDIPNCDLSRNIPVYIGIEKLFSDIQG